MLNRRDFLKMIAGTGTALGFPSSLIAFQGLIRHSGKPQTGPEPTAFPYFLSDGKFFYLLGNLEDKGFIGMRESILSTDPFYLWSIAITDSNTLPFRPAGQESVILLPRDISSHTCDTLIRDLRLLLHPGQFVGIDYADVLTVLGGKAARYLFVEGTQHSFGRNLRDLVCRSKRDFDCCNRLLMVFSGRLDCMDLSEIDGYAAFIGSSVAPDTEIVHTASFFETWKEEYALSLIMN